MSKMMSIEELEDLCDKAEKGYKDHPESARVIVRIPRACKGWKTLVWPGVMADVLDAGKNDTVIAMKVGATRAAIKRLKVRLGI